MSSSALIPTDSHDLVRLVRSTKGILLLPPLFNNNNNNMSQGLAKCITTSQHVFSFALFHYPRRRPTRRSRLSCQSNPKRSCHQHCPSTSFVIHHRHHPASLFSHPSRPFLDYTTLPICPAQSISYHRWMRHGRSRRRLCPRQSWSSRPPPRERTRHR